MHKLLGGSKQHHHEHHQQHHHHHEGAHHHHHHSGSGADLGAHKGSVSIWRRSGVPEDTLQRRSLSKESVKKTVVGIGFDIRQVKDVDCIYQTYFCDFTCIMKWYDEQFNDTLQLKKRGSLLKSKPGGSPRAALQAGENRMLSMSEVAIPVHYIANQADLTVRDEIVYISSDDPPGIVTYEAMYTGTLSEFMELEYFPIDVQDLTISIRFKEADIVCKCLTPKNKFQRIRESVECLEWLMYEPEMYIDTNELGRQTWSLKMRIFRQGGFYIWNVLFPILCFLAMAFCSFLYEAYMWYERSGHLFQIIIAFIAFKLVIASSLPKVSFSTVLDLFLQPSFAFLMLLVCQFAIMKLLFVFGYFEDDSIRARQIDVAVGAIIFAVWFISNLLYIHNFNRITAQQKASLGKLLDLPTQMNKINVLSMFLGISKGEEEEETGQINPLAEPIKVSDLPKKKADKNIVAVGYEIQQVKDIDAIQQIFFCSFVLTLKWYAPGLKVKKKGPYKNTPINEDDAPTPIHYIANAVNVELRDTESFLDPKDPEGIVTNVSMYAGTLSEFMELECFPIDAQDLTISVRFQDTIIRCQTLEGSEFQKISEALQLSEYYMYSPVFAVEVGKQGRCTWSLKLKVFRKDDFYFWNVLFPVCCFSFLAFYAFLYESHMWYERSCYLLEILLDFVAFKFIVSDSMPKVPFFVIIDLYLFPSFIFLMALLFHSAIFKLLFLVGTFKEGSKEARQLDVAIVAVLFVFWCVGHIIFAMRYRATSAENKHALGPLLDIPSQTESVNILQTFMGWGGGSAEGEEEGNEVERTEVTTAEQIAGSPIVGIGFEIKQVKDVDCVAQCFYCDFTLTLKFYAEELVKKKTDPKQKVALTVDDVEVPAHYIKNAVSVVIKDECWYMAPDEPPGVVTYEAMHSGTIAEFMELEYFPLDTQDLTISIQFQDSHVIPKNLDPSELYQRIRPEVQMSEWTMYEPKVNVEVGKNGRSMWQVKLVIYREWGYYVTNILLPVGLINFMSFYSFLYEPDQWYERACHDLALLSALIFFKFVIGESLPKVSFFTVLDLYIFPSFVFLLVMMTVFALMKLLTLIGILEAGSDLARLVDLSICLGLFGMWVAAQVIFVYRFRATDTKQRSSLGPPLGLTRSVPEGIFNVFLGCTGTSSASAEEQQDFPYNEDIIARGAGYPTQGRDLVRNDHFNYQPMDRVDSPQTPMKQASRDIMHHADKRRKG